MQLKRIALIGTSSVGKTTVFELLKSRLPKYEFITETTRTVKKYGYPINEHGTDNTQLAISNLHLNSLLLPYNLVLDRCYLDLVVYTMLMSNVGIHTKSFIQNMWEKVQDHYTHIIYFPIEFKVVEDGVRSTDETWRENVDNRFKEELTKLNRQYLTIKGSPLQRVDQILNYIEHEKRSR